MVSLATLALVVGVQVFSGCSATNTTKGGAIGAGAGSVIGGALGHRSDNTVVGAIIGAAVGGSAGALIGRQMDKQADELERDLEGAEVQRVGEGILITFNSGLQFDINSASIRTDTQTNLNTLAATLKKYDDTAILIEGHTDNTGEVSYNQTLSERRAYSVGEYLAFQGVSKSRVSTKGFGELQPLNTNSSDDERQINRRVEVAIVANKAMKKMAKKGVLVIEE